MRGDFSFGRLPRPDGSLVSFDGLPTTDAQAEELLARPGLPDFLPLDSEADDVGQAATRTLYRIYRAQGDSIEGSLERALLSMIGGEA